MKETRAERRAKFRRLKRLAKIWGTQPPNWNDLKRPKEAKHDDRDRKNVRH